MEELFQTDRTSFLRHIKNIYKTGELVEETTCAKIAQVRQEGKRIAEKIQSLDELEREMKHMKLDLKSKKK